MMSKKNPLVVTLEGRKGRALPPADKIDNNASITMQVQQEDGRQCAILVGTFTLYLYQLYNKFGDFRM